MKRYVLALVFPLAGCKKVETGDADDMVRLRDIILTKTQYMRVSDGLCVGYFWARDGSGQSAVGGPVVFVVPCELLTEKTP